MVINMWTPCPPNIGDELVVAKRTMAYGERHGCWTLIVPGTCKHWHGSDAYPGVHYEYYGLRRVESVGESRYAGQIRIILSDDLYPDHP